MVEALVALSISLFLFLINFFISKNIFYPPTLYTLIWSIVFLSYVFFLAINNNLSFELDTITLVIFLAGEIIFSTFALFAIPKTNITFQVTEIKILYKIDQILLLFLILVLPFYINLLVNIANQSKLANVNIYLALRHEYVSTGVKIGIFDYVNTVSVFAFALAVYRFNFTNFKNHPTLGKTIYKVLYYLVPFIYAFLSTGRTYFVLLLSIYIGLKVMAKAFGKKHLIVASSLFFVLFIVNALILGKGADIDASYADNAKSIIENLTIYFLGGSYGFDSIIKSGFTLDFGEHTFRFFISVAHALGLTSTAPAELVMPYVTTPMITNVYTVYYLYVKDFGYLGLIFIAIWGYLHTYFYYKAKGSFLNLYIYALLLYPLMMSFFQDQYLSLLSTWIQLILFGIIASKFIVITKSNTNHTI